MKLAVKNNHALIDGRRKPAAYFGSVGVPSEAGNGKAKLTLSFPDWREGKVAPATFEVPITDAKKEDPSGGAELENHLGYR
jgi:hypothetical protein